MNCADVDRQLSGGANSVPNPAELQNHVASCDRCGRLVQASNRIGDLLRRDLNRVLPWPPLWVSVAGILALAAAFAGIQAFSLGTAGWNEFAAPQLIVLGIWAAAVIIAGAVSLDASVRPAAREWVPSWLPVLLLALGFPALAGLLFPAGPTDNFVSDGLKCFSGCMVIAALSGAFAYGFARRGYVTNWPRTGALLGVIGAAIAAVALQISCSDHIFAHMIVWHGMAIVLPVIVGWTLGRRLQNA